jgi:GNAT superfamily N-acetyltransferase
VARRFDVRLASAEECELLPGLEAASDTLFGSIAMGPFPAPGSPAELRAALAVLVVDTPPAGFARIEAKPWGPHLEQLSVHPARFRQGLGRTLVQAACQWARHAGYRKLTLGTYRDVPWNGLFYASEGFVEEGPVDAWYAAHGEEAEDPVMGSFGARVLMSRPL